MGAEVDAILEMVAMRGDDGATTKELIVASGQRVTETTRRKMQAHLAGLVDAGKLTGGQGLRPSLRFDSKGNRVMAPVPVFRPVK